MKLKILLRLLNVLHNTKLLAGLLLLLLLLAITNEVAIYHIGLITGDYYQILNNKDHRGFIRQTIKSVLLIIAMTLLKSLKESCASYLSICWRKRLTQDLHGHYFANLAYYMLNVVLPTSLEDKKKVNFASVADNVDQRLTQDVERMTTSLGAIIPELLVAPFIIVFYGSKCYQLNGWVGPLGCLAFFLVSTLINRFLIANVSHYVYAQERREGDFRYQHMRIRAGAESIAFLSDRRSSFEKGQSNRFLDQLISTQTRLILHQLALKISIYLADYLGSILSFIAIAVPLFAGLYDHLSAAELSKLISQNAFFTIYLINCFTRLIDLSGYLSTFLGTASRIGELYVWFGWIRGSGRFGENSIVLEAVRAGCGDENGLSNGEKVYFDVRKLTIRPPISPLSIDKAAINSSATPLPLISNLSFAIEAEKSLLISGPSGVGKSSLLRTIKGIWKPVSGSVLHSSSLEPIESPKKVLFLPQKPLLTTGSLAEQMIYPEVLELPAKGNQQLKDRLEAILKFLELEKAILTHGCTDIFENGSDQNINWSDLLSVGEVQRLQLARVFYHQPTVAFLDESTSALPVALEEKIMTELIDRLAITLVSVGHRNSLRKFHQRELKIISCSEFELIDLENACDDTK